MPTFEVDPRALTKAVGAKMAAGRLADRIAMMGAVVENGENGNWMVEAFPNRPDLLSEEGLARALRGFLGIETGLADYRVHNSEYKAYIDESVRGVREYVAAAVVTGMPMDKEAVASLMRMQEKLHMTHSRNRKLASIGVYDLDKIKFPLEYTTVRGDYRFVPLGYGREMAISEILREHPKGKEYAHLLEGTDLYPIWFDANGKVLSLPPIINSADTAVTADTKNLFVDVTGLNRRVVGQALHIIAAQLADRGGKIHNVHFGDFATPNMEPRKVKLELSYCNRLLGLELSQKEMEGHLKRMRYGVEGGYVLVPAYRTDVLHPIDLVEDVAIAYGYENFKPLIPPISTIGGESKKTVFERKAAEVLVGFGFLECNSYHLTSAEMPKRMMSAKKLIRTLNPVNANYNAIRNSLLPGLLQVLSDNKHHDYPQRLFDSGIAVDGKMRERLHLAAVSCQSKADFTEAKSYVESLLLTLGYKPEFDAINRPFLLAGRAATVIVNKKEVGVVGEIHPEVLENFGMKLPVAAFEIGLEKLIS